MAKNMYIIQFLCPATICFATHNAVRSNEIRFAYEILFNSPLSDSVGNNAYIIKYIAGNLNVFIYPISINRALHLFNAAAIYKNTRSILSRGYNFRSAEISRIFCLTFQEPLQYGRRLRACRVTLRIYAALVRSGHQSGTAHT